MIDTTPACDAAAVALGLSDTTTSIGIDSPRYRPYGCVWNRGTLQLNLHADARLRGTAPDNSVKQVCDGAPTETPTAAPTPGPDPRGALLVETGDVAMPGGFFEPAGIAPDGDRVDWAALPARRLAVSVKDTSE